MNKKKSFWSKSVLLFAAAGALLLLSTVGNTRAALTYYSENYGMQVAVSNTGVSLEENGIMVSYVPNDGSDKAINEPLLTHIPGSVTGQNTGKDEKDENVGEKFQLGKEYQEELSVTNRGDIDTYVRVTVMKSWMKDGKKDTKLSPDLIRMDMDQKNADNGWIKDASASADGTGTGAYQERMVLYYTTPLKPGKSSTLFNSKISIDPVIGQEVTQEKEGNVIRTSYKYNGYSFQLEVSVDAVQTHNAEDAIKSAWGKDVSIAANGTLSLR